MGDGFLKHEAIDRLDIINRMIDELLCNHEYIATDSTVLLQVRKAQWHIAKAYRMVEND